MDVVYIVETDLGIYDGGWTEQFRGPLDRAMEYYKKEVELEGSDYVRVITVIAGCESNARL